MASPPNVQAAELGYSSTRGLAGVRVPISYSISLPGLVGTNKVITGDVFGFNGRILAIKFKSTMAATGAGAAATITPSLGGVNLAGGVLSLTLANCGAGAVVLASAITGLNTFTPTTPFDLTLSGVTAFTAGQGSVIVEVSNDDLVDVLADSVGGLRVP